MTIMDKSVFIGMAGAQTAMQELQVVANNLANANTVGFRADRTFAKPFEVSDSGLQSRAYAKMSQTYTAHNQGPLIATGADLDMGISGDGFFVLQNKDGKEAYTRNGSFQMTTDGILTNSKGLLVIGLQGPITIPQQTEKIKIGNDGLVSAKIVGNTDFSQVGYIKLVKPEPGVALVKGADGLFYAGNDEALKADKNVTLLTNVLEGSNVNAIEELTRMIDITRRYEAQMKLIKAVGDNSANANQLLAVSR